MDSATPSIADEIWWVLPQALAGVRKPLPEELPALQAAGIGAIISVMDDPANLDAYEAAGWPYQWLPIAGGTAPTPEQLQQLHTFIARQHAAGLAVAVHCTSGRRRTGTAIAAYLIHTGYTYDAALAAIQQANPAVEMREAQLHFLQSLASA